MKLYLVRHGETHANVRGVYYGSSDLDLNAQGLLQAQQLAELLRNVHFDNAITSGLKRTQQTAKEILAGRQIEHAQAEHQHIEVHSMPELNEINFGDWEGRNYQDIAVEDPQTYRDWCQDWINIAPPKGESFLQFQQRLTPVFHHLLSAYADQDLLLVGHQGVLRVLMLFLLEMPSQAFWHFDFQQGAYSVIDITEGYPVIRLINAGIN